MRQFKIIDFWINIGLIVSSFIISILEGTADFLHNGFLIGYFIAGGWQIISMLVHAYSRCFTYKWGARYIYHWITLIAVITMPDSFWVLIIAAPVLQRLRCFQDNKYQEKYPAPAGQRFL